MILIGGLGIGAVRSQAAPPQQRGTPIRYGDTLSGEITESVPCVHFWFEGYVGDPITIDMTRTSGSLDGVLALYQRDGDTFSADPLITNDDRDSGGLDPLITFRLPADDWYTIAACRLEADQMRATTGVFDLTLTGPASDSGGATDSAAPTPAGSLTEGLFGAASPTPVPTQADGLSGGVFPPAGESASPTPTAEAASDTAAFVLLDGSVVEGALAADQAGLEYSLVVLSGDEVAIRWSATGGDLAPALRVTGSAGDLVTAAQTDDSASTLMLAFRAPSEDLLTLTVARADAQTDSTGTFEIAVTITTPNGAGSAVAPTPIPEEGTDYLAAPCMSGAAAISGPVDSARLLNVYSAAGDSYDPAELTETTSLRPTDDLNVVYDVPADSGSVRVAGLFCAPDGSYYDAGESDATGGLTSLLGLDWEYNGTDWPSGAWYVEIYVDDTLELTLGFVVE
jgi:hypothetical protein